MAVWAAPFPLNSSSLTTIKNSNLHLMHLKNQTHFKPLTHSNHRLHLINDLFSYLHQYCDLSLSYQFQDFPQSTCAQYAYCDYLSTYIIHLHENSTISIYIHHPQNPTKTTHAQTLLNALKILNQHNDKYSHLFEDLSYYFTPGQIETLNLNIKIQ
jgi:hypothetical protein